MGFSKADEMIKEGMRAAEKKVEQLRKDLRLRK